MRKGVCALHTEEPQHKSTALLALTSSVAALPPVAESTLGFRHRMSAGNRKPIDVHRNLYATCETQCPNAHGCSERDKYEVA